MNKQQEGAPLSLLFFGVTLGTIVSSLFHTSRGKQLVHDASLFMDDLAAMLEHTLQDDVSFEESIEGVRVFGDHVLDKLDRVGGLGGTQTVKQGIIQPKVVQKHVVVDKKKSVIHQDKQEPAGAFLYHQPVEIPSKKHSYPVDDELAVLQKVARSMFR